MKRTKQIGIRRALGATRGFIWRYFLLESLVVTLFGLLPGLLLMIPLNVMIVSAFQFGRFEWSHAVGCFLFLAAIGFVSSALPVLRAVAVSPATATRTA